MKDNFNNFNTNLQKENYYEAHEDLEKIWFPRRFENSDEIKLIKGFINAAVSFELLKKGKVNQSKKVWKNYLKYRDLIFKLEKFEYYTELSNTLTTIETIYSEEYLNIYNYKEED